MKKLNSSFSRNSSGVSIMKPTEVKQEYQLQIWSSMIQEQKASGLSIKKLVYGKWSVRKQLLLQAAEDSPDGLCRTGADERNNDSRNTTGPQNQFLSAGQDHNEIRDGRDF